MSTIDISSIIKTSASIGEISVSIVPSLSSSTFPISNSLCIVFASSPVVSVILFAALPVGAQSTTFLLCALYKSNIHFIIVVFPVPGPPVIMHTLFSFICSIASNCFSDNFIASFVSCLLISSLKFFIYFTFLNFCSFRSLSAILVSALKNGYKYTQSSPFLFSIAISSFTFKLIRTFSICSLSTSSNPCTKIIKLSFCTQVFPL